MSDVFFKPSHKIDSFFSDNFSVDSENFLTFIKAYYEWLQTTRIEISNVSGTFQRNEIVTGQTSGAYGIIREVGTDYIVVLVQSTLRFSRKEILVGSTSNATANIVKIKDNTVRATGNLLEYRDIEKSIDDYVEYLREELFPTIPTKYIEDKKLIATKLKSFFESRSSEESYRFLFKLLYNENIEFRYPGEEILRASDGKFEKTNFIRAVPVPNIFDFLNKTIRGQSSNAFGTIVDIKKFFFGTTEIAELTLKLVSGTFLPNETIEDVSDPSLVTTIFGMITGFNIIDGGSGYSVGNLITISGNGNNAVALVSSITRSPISALIENEIGYGYRLNTRAVINNSGTGGVNLDILVTGITNTYSVTDGSNTYTVGEISELSIANRGENYSRAPIITIEDFTIASLGLLSDKLINIANSGIDYGVGNTLVFTGGSGTNAAGQIASVVESVTYDFLLEDDSRIIIDGSFEDILKDEDWDVIGPIRRIELTNFGSGYTTNNLPTITINTTTGSGASLIPFEIQGKSANVSVDVVNNVSGIGSIRSLQLDNFGLNYTSATVDATSTGDGNANLVPIITGLAVKDGEFLNDDGKIGIRVLIDSFFFQDFSYVIKSGLPFVTYRDELKKIIHPAGLQPFGEILLTNTLDLRSTQIDSSPTIIIESEIDLSLGILLEIDVSEIKTDITSLISVAVSDISAIAISEIEVKLELETNLESNFIDKQEVTLEIEKLIVNESNIDKSSFNIFLGSKTISSVFEINLKTNILNSIETNLESNFIDKQVNFEIQKLIVNESDIDKSSLNIFVQSEISNGFEINSKTNILNSIETNLESNFIDKQVNFEIQKLIVNESNIDKSSFNFFIESNVDNVFEINPETKILNSIETNLESNFIDKKVNFEIQKLISSESDIDKSSFNFFIESQVDSNVIFEPQSTLTKYKQIQGTVSSSFGIEYKDLLLSDFANATISSISDFTFLDVLPSVLGDGSLLEYKDLLLSDFANTPVSVLSNFTFSETLSLIVGNGTIFTSDFINGDTLLANNELFTVVLLINDTALTIDKNPSLPFQDVFAYKVI
jgi:hypothetical protein